MFSQKDKTAAARPTPEKEKKGIDKDKMTTEESKFVHQLFN